MTHPPRRRLLKALAALALAAPALGNALAGAPAQAQAPDNHPLPRRGDYVPAEVMQAGPKVEYAAMHLRKPPAGYGWYQLGHTYVMASVATGLIVEVVVL